MTPDGSPSSSDISAATTHLHCTCPSRGTFPSYLVPPAPRSPGTSTYGRPPATGVISLLAILRTYDTQRLSQPTGLLKSSTNGIIYPVSFPPASPFRDHLNVTTYTIDQFWRSRLQDATTVPAPLIEGWSFVTSGLKTFQEAPLTHRTDLDEEADPSNAPILLVSAPGAVGKTTLARQIAYRTGALYVDLGAAGPVGANTLSGGLLQSQLVHDWSAGRIAILIDGLDEARLRVTQEAFDAFSHDVAQLAKGRQLPTVLFGRTGATEDAWLVLADDSVESTVLEIGCYGPDQANAFVHDLVDTLRPNDPHRSVRLHVSDLLLSHLRQQTAQDGDRFAGYAPVLNAVAERVTKETNPGALASRITTGSTAVTLQDVVDAILTRERSKLATLTFEDATISDKLYLPVEQLDHLVAQRYGTTRPAPIPAMSSRDRERYDRALETWIGEHPFLAGGTDSSPSVVFDAAITAHALASSDAARGAVQRELQRGANPFLSVFYPPQSGATAPDFVQLPAEHIGIVYSSVRARLTLSETASLVVAELGDERDVEISIRNDQEGRERTLLKCRSSGTGTVCIGPHLADAAIDVPRGRLEIGTGAEVTLVAPIHIECDDLWLKARTVVVEASPQGAVTGAVVLKGGKVRAPISAPPILRGNVHLAVSWPGSQIYPWHEFAAHMDEIDEQHIREGLQRLRRLVTAFRARGKDQLARIRDKIDSPRMMRGLGSAVLKAMMDNNIIRLDGKLYVLDATALGRIVGVTYIDCARQRFSQKAIEFVERIVK